MEKGGEWIATDANCARYMYKGGGARSRNNVINIVSPFYPQRHVPRPHSTFCVALARRKLVGSRENTRREKIEFNAEERTGCAIMSVSCAFPLQHWQSCASGMVVMRDCLIKMFVFEVFKINADVLYFACDYESSAVGMRLSVHHWSRELSSKEELLYIFTCAGA